MLNFVRILIFTYACFFAAGNYQLQNTSTALPEREYCDLLPHCVCITTNSLLTKTSKLVCENHINVQITSGLKPHPVRFATNILMVCHPNITSDSLNHNYYTLLNLQLYPPEMTNLVIYSCPEPPMSYFSFVSPTPTKVASSEDVSNISLIALNINCDGYNKVFSLKRKHLLGFNSLKNLYVNCSFLHYIPVDLFHDTTPLLYSLTIHSTKVSDLHTGIFSELSRLQKFSFINNTIKSLPKDIFIGLISLTDLDFSDNKLNSLNDDVFTPLKKLRKLDLKNNMLSLIPTSIGNLISLEYLELSHNKLDSIDRIKDLENLKKLYVRYNRLTHVSISSLKSIRYIDLTGNSIIMFDDIPFLLHNLVSFIMNDNSQNLSLQLFLISDSIEDLVFSNSSVSFIHTDLLKNMKSLKKVDLSKNNITKLGNDIFLNNSNLYYIGLQENNISELAPNIFIGNPGLEILNISNNRIRILPENIFANNHELKTLDLSRNFLTVLPNTLLQNLSMLSVLKITDNKVTSLHEFFFETNSELEKLDLSGNMLDNLPKQIFSSFKDEIIRLDLARNQISFLPLLQFPSLIYLNLSHNNIEFLPYGIFDNFSSIEKLILSHNSIRNFSNDCLLPNHLNMELLDLSYNKLSYIPKGTFKNRFLTIKKIDFSGNLMEKFYIDCIGDVKDLIELRAADNNMSYFGIDPEVEFWDLFPSIKLLDLSNNKLDFNQGSWFYDDIKHTWGKISNIIRFINIEVLLLSNNSISRIFLDWRDDLHYLQLLDLRYNKIQHIYHQDVLYTSPNAPHVLPIKNTEPRPILHPRLKNSNPLPPPPLPLTVDLRWNLITTVDIPNSKLISISLDKNGTVPEGIYGHGLILLDGNPFTCDCKMLDFLKIVSNDLAPISDLRKKSGKDWIMPAKIDIGNLSCWEPQSIRLKKLAEPETWMHHILPLLSLCSLFQ